MVFLFSRTITVIRGLMHLALCLGCWFKHRYSSLHWRDRHDRSRIDILNFLIFGICLKANLLYISYEAEVVCFCLFLKPLACDL